MKNLNFTATAKPVGFAMPSCALLTDGSAVKVRDAHFGAGAAVRHKGSHSWMRLRSTT